MSVAGSATATEPPRVATNVGNAPSIDATIGPDGKDPSIILPKILNFLLDEDIYRTPAWEGKLGVVKGYLERAEKARLRGELGYSNPHTVALLKDALILVDVHRRFHEWKSGPTRWSTHTLPGQPCSVRLPNFPDHPFQARPNKSRYRQKRYDFLRPHDNKKPFPSLSRRGNVALDTYRVAQELYYENSVKAEADRVNLDNGFQIDNEQYELCMAGGISETLRLAPSRLPGNVPADAEDDAAEDADQMSGNLREFFRSRGWRRAALQQCLNKFSSHENRVINTPWRRVVLPFKAPIPLPKELVYHARALPAEKVPNRLKDPTPWFYNFNQYAMLMNSLTGWERRRYNLENWNDFQRAALPVNYFGPYVHRGLCIYDDHWLRMGAYLRRLHALLEDSFGAAPRPFMLAILRDIQAGMSWRPGQAVSRRDSRPDIMRRGGIDMQEGPNPRRSTVMLIDETDAAWLRFLCEPSRTNAMCDPKKQPDQNLSILFDHRLQSFLNETGSSGTPGVGQMDIFQPDWHAWADSNFESLPSVEDTLSYINGGSGAEECHANETYQFTLAEAKFHFGELGRLDRCKIVPEFPKAGVTDGLAPEEHRTHVARPTYTIHPEHRVRWRHENGREFIKSQGTYSETIMRHLLSAYQLTRPGARIKREEMRYVLDHLGRNGRFGEVPESTPFNEYFRPLIVPELDFVRGSYRPGGVEDTRQSPSWSDLASWDQLGSLQRRMEVNLDVPEKTAQFFRNLAYRMGRTIAHVRQIEERLRYSVSDDQPEETDQWRSVSRAELVNAIEHWQKITVRGLGPIEFKPPEIESVVSKVDPQGAFKAELDIDTEDDFAVIREGIINDCVENRNTMYPSRQLAVEDSSGHYNSVDDFKADKLIGGLKRPSLFKWATPAQRQYQSIYTRRAFFSMTRWPLHHQRPERRRIIEKRRDEVDRIFPSRQRHGILLQRLPTENEKSQYYGSTVYPVTKETNLGTSSETGTKDVTKESETEQPSQGTKEQTQLPTPENSTSGNPSAQPIDTISPPQPPNMSTATSGTAAEQPAEQPAQPTAQLRPLVREDGRYIPGPAVFPMAETLLQQIAISRSLESALYPEEELSVWGTISKIYNNLTRVDPPKIPLLPPTKEIDIPRSNPRKRPLPANYIIPPDLIAKRPRKEAKKPGKKPSSRAATPTATSTGASTTPGTATGTATGTTTTTATTTATGTVTPTGSTATNITYPSPGPRIPIPSSKPTASANPLKPAGNQAPAPQPTGAGRPASRPGAPNTPRPTGPQFGNTSNTQGPVKISKPPPGGLFTTPPGGSQSQWRPPVVPTASTPAGTPAPRPQPVAEPTDDQLLAAYEATKKLYDDLLARRKHD